MTKVARSSFVFRQAHMPKLQTRSILVVGLLLAGLGLLGLSQTGMLEPVQSALLAPLATLQQWVARATGGASALGQPQPDLDTLRQRNAELEAQVTQLQSDVVRLRENEAQLNLLAGLLNYARTQPDNRYLAANVIGRDPSPFVHYVILDRGSNAGVQKDMPVVTGQGLVGRIVQVTSAASKVQLIVDSTSAVNARLQASRDEGVVVGQPAGGLEMQFISQQASVQPGDLVITSGLGGKYPAGVVLGTVSVVEKQAYEVVQRAELTSAVDFNRLEIVLIIVNFQPIDFGPFLQPTPTPAVPAP